MTSPALALAVLQMAHPKLGLAVNIPAGGGLPELTASVLEARHLGCDLVVDDCKWSELEPRPGQFEFATLRENIKNQMNLGFEPYVLLKPLDTNQKALPADLRSTPWDAPAMRQRWTRFLRALSERLLSPGMHHIMLGNEVDAYLSAHPGEIAGYADFVGLGVETLHAIDRGWRVGVTTTFPGLAASPEILRKVNAATDFVSMTYSPLRPDFSAQPPSETRRNFEAMLTFAGAKPLLIQEAGYPSSELLGSSENRQAEFVDRVFDEMRRNPTRLLGVSFFISIDFSDQVTDGFVKYYGVGADRFRAMLSSLGLKRQDGNPKRAWDTFIHRAQRRAEGR